MVDFSEIVITDVSNAITISSKKGRYEKMYKRKSFGLTFCTEGQITYTQNGVNYVSDKNHAVILPKDKSYTIHGDKNGIFPVINFECINFSSDTIKVIPINNTESFIKDFEKMKSLFVFKENRAEILSIMYGIIHRLSNTDKSESSILTPAIKYLENNLSQPELTNKKLAACCNISEVYFRRLFSKSYGKSPRQYIIDARINKAKQILTDETVKISTVSERCGFSNPYHFCRLFKEKTGLTPTKYMKQNKIYKI